MKILFLGTGAADWPAEKPADAKEFRRLSSALIDDVLLLDPGPGVPAAMEEFAAAPEKVRYVINTHRHSDHYNGDTLAWLTGKGAEFVDFRPGDKKQLGAYTIEAFAANHATCPDPAPVHFMITDGEKTVFYGLDGAWLLYHEYKAIMRDKPDLAVLDATVGDIKGDFRLFEHNDLNMVREMKLTLAPYVGRFCISHMARTLHTDHETLSETMKKDGIEAAFDGYLTEV